MAAVVACAPVFDPETGRTHMPGHVIDMDPARAEALVESGAARWASRAAGGGAAASWPEEPCPLSGLYEGMTRAQLVDVAGVRGVEVPARATKAEIVALLEAER